MKMQEKASERIRFDSGIIYVCENDAPWIGIAC